MTGDNETIIWSFDFSEALESDPALADPMRRVSPTHGSGFATAMPTPGWSPTSRPSSR